MSVFISGDRVKAAVVQLCNWRGAVKQQSTAHVFPLLALLEKGVSTESSKVFEESDDFAFFDKYCKVAGNPEKPYFDPFSREFRIASHPHSNIATARKNTFQNRWKAAELSTQGDTNSWKLSKDFAKLFAEKLFPKAGAIQRINVLDLACWLFRSEEFPDGASAESIQKRFQERFPLSQADYDQLFVFQPEPSENLFQSSKLSPAELDSLISGLAFKDAAIAGKEAFYADSNKPDTPALPEDDPILVEVKALLSLGTSGIILRGAPGTGKSWYADQVALSLTGGDRARIFRVQFHPSYTYEDFFDGFLPSEKTASGFEITGKIFRRAIEQATKTDGAVVLLIDEVNRGNTAKIFGEALTYIEHGWRNVKFTPRLSVNEIAVPSNLIVLATMNPHDRSITPLDMALLRRFDQIDVPPSVEAVSEFLEAAGMHPSHVELIGDWFSNLQTMLPFGIGHTFFLNITDVGKLGLVWRYRILPFCQSILEYEQARLDAVINSFEALDKRLRETVK